MADNVPRRVDLKQNTKAEIAIRKAMAEVEEVGADPKLTFVTSKLREAFETLADYNDLRLGG